MYYSLQRVMSFCLCSAFLTRAAPSQRESRQTIVVYGRVNFTGAVTIYNDNFSTCKDIKGTGPSLASSAELRVGNCVRLCPHLCSLKSKLNCVELTSSENSIRLFNDALNDNLCSIRECSASAEPQQLPTDYD